MSEHPHIVAIGLLTKRDLDILGQGFDRVFPIDRSGGFEDLLQAIDEADRKLRSTANAPPD